MNTSISILALIVIVLLVLCGLSALRASRSTRLCGLFRLDAKQYQLLGTDLGRNAGPIRLLVDGLIGVPDALFRKRDGDLLIVGEAKSRHYRGRVTLYERYQVTLYMGMCIKRYGKPVAGRIRYGCGHVVPLSYDPEIYRQLKSLIPQYEKVVASFRAKGSRTRRQPA